MAKNESRDMVESLQMGVNDGRYMVLNPDWGGDPVANPPAARLGWPTYSRVKPRESTRNHLERVWDES